MSLRYPSDGFSGDADYVSFRHQRYSSRQGNGGGGGGGGYITLYMPENMQTVSNANAWEEFTFGAGPVGGVVEDLFDEAVRVTNIDFTKGMKKEAIEKGIDRVRNKFEALGNNMGAIGRQLALDATGQMLNISPNQALSVTTGQIYNPNIELAYNGPGLRTFAFRFKMVPKSAGEATNISNIIREFKTWSAPQLIEGGMYEIPHVWQVNFMSGGGMNAFQNTFKPAALTNVTVQDNTGLGYYSAHQGGAPISTSLSLTFKEVDVITRRDHTGLRGM